MRSVASWARSAVASRKRSRPVRLPTSTLTPTPRGSPPGRPGRDPEISRIEVSIRADPFVEEVEAPPRRPTATTTGETMAEIHVHEFMSLDGVIDAPMWTAEYGFTDGMGERIGAVTGRA